MKNRASATIEIYSRDFVPESLPRLVVMIGSRPPWHCTAERLPEMNEVVFIDRQLYGPQTANVYVVADRKYTLPMYGRPETWLRLEAA